MRVKEWINKASKGLWNALPDKFVLDWDSTVQIKYGNQQGAEVGYNPMKKGRKSYHPLFAVADNTRLCLHYHWHRGQRRFKGMESCNG